MRTTRVVVSSLLVSLLSISVLLADDAVPAAEGAKRKWKDAAEFSLLTTNGNSRGTTTSGKNTFTYNWSDLTGLEFLAGGRGSSNAGTVTSEQYNASEKVTWKLIGANYVYERFGWDQDRFAGIANRWDASAGLGRLLLDLKNDKINTELGGGYVNEERTSAPRNDFASGRAYAKYVHTLSATANFSQDAEYLHNFKNRKGYRLNTETALIASLSTHLSLKTSFVWKRNALPPPGAIKDDTTTAVALIVNY